MTDVAGAAGAAHDPEVIAVNGDTAKVTTDQEDPRPALEAAVRSAEGKVEKARAHLAGAEAGLSEAQAALAASEG